MAAFSLCLFLLSACADHRSVIKGQKSVSLKVEKGSESKSEVDPKKEIGLGRDTWWVRTYVLSTPHLQ